MKKSWKKVELTWKKLKKVKTKSWKKNNFFKKSWKIEKSCKIEKSWKKSVKTRGVLNERAACLFLEPNIDGSWDWKKTPHSVTKNCTSRTTQQDYSHGKGITVTFARHHGNMPAIVLELHMRVIAGGDWASPAS